MEKGIDVVDLLASDVFNYTFDYEGWPKAHHNDQAMLMPYNGSLFDLRKSYPMVFGTVLDAPASFVPGET